MNIRTKLPWVLSLALLSGGAYAQGGSTDLLPPAPPPPPIGDGDIHRHASDSELESQLAAAQRQLEQAAHQVAELSARVNRPFIQRFSATDGSFGRVIVGVQLDPASGKDGVRVTSVSPGGPAAEAGIRAGDLIVNVNGRDVIGGDAPRQMMKIIRQVKPDAKVVVRVVRDDSVRVFSVTPRQGPDDVVFSGPFAGISAPLAPPSFMVDGPVSNMELATLTPRLGKYFGTDKGVLVIRAPHDGQLKLQDGDVILAIDGREPTSGSHATRILGSYQPGEKITMKIVRERKTLELQSTI